MNEELIKYMKKGLDKGFNLSHIKDVLIRHGHSHSSVNEAEWRVRALYPQFFEQPQVKPILSKKYMPFMYVLIALTVAVLGTTMYFNYTIAKENENLVKINVTQQLTIRQQLDDISDLSKSIDVKQNQIDAQIDEISGLNMLVSDKETLVKEQLEQMKMLNSMVKEERSKVRTMLLELINSMFSRGFTV